MPYSENGSDVDDFKTTYKQVEGNEKYESFLRVDEK